MPVRQKRIQPRVQVNGGRGLHGQVRGRGRPKDPCPDLGHRCCVCRSRVIFLLFIEFRTLPRCALCMQPVKSVTVQLPARTYTREGLGAWDCASSQPQFVCCWHGCSVFCVLTHAAWLALLHYCTLSQPFGFPAHAATPPPSPPACITHVRPGTTVGPSALLWCLTSRHD